MANKSVCSAPHAFVVDEAIIIDDEIGGLAQHEDTATAVQDDAPSQSIMCSIDRQRPKLLSSRSYTSGLTGSTLSPSMPELSTVPSGHNPKRKRTASDAILSMDARRSGVKDVQALKPLEGVATKSKTGYLANRRSFTCSQELLKDEAEGNQEYTEKSCVSTHESNKSSTLIRLSMTANGRAKVVTEAEISPPKKQPIPIDLSTSLYDGGKCNKYDECALDNTLLQSENGVHYKVPKLKSGRSRDSRAWEFWCDAEARNSLSQKADKEWSGSAADAIDLMRVNSNGARKGLDKRNRNVLTDISNKRLKSHDRKQRPSKIKRIASAYGRLQSKDESINTNNSLKKPLIIEGVDKDEKDVELPQTESDKENWDPEESYKIKLCEVGQSNAVSSCRKLLDVEKRTILHDSSLATTKKLASMRGTNNRRNQSRVMTGNDPEEDEEIARFMGGRDDHLREGNNSFASKEEEMHCIESLLSLRSGTWGLRT